jgi:hypothetical protein
MILKAALLVLAFAAVGWALCGATLAVARALISLRVALWIHLAAAPAIFAVLSWVYFRQWGLTTPLQTAAAFTLIVVLLDAAIVAQFIERSYAMFFSILGTWLPFVLIFLATWASGQLAGRPAP